MDFIIKKKLDIKLYKTLNKIYDLDYDYVGKLDDDDFNQYIVILVKSGLKKDEIKDLIIRTIDGEDNELKYFINDNKITSTNSVYDIIFLILFGIIFMYALIKLFI